MGCIARYKCIILLACISRARYTTETMAKKMTIEDLAVMVKRGFDETAKKEGVDKRFDEVDERFDKIDKRLDHIENLILRDHVQRIERLEDTVLQLKVKVGMR